VRFGLLAYETAFVRFAGLVWGEVWRRNSVGIRAHAGTEPAATPAGGRNMDASAS